MSEHLSMQRIAHAEQARLVFRRVVLSSLVRQANNEARAKGDRGRAPSSAEKRLEALLTLLETPRLPRVRTGGQPVVPLTRTAWWRRVTLAGTVWLVAAAAGVALVAVTGAGSAVVATCELVVLAASLTLFALALSAPPRPVARRAAPKNHTESLTSRVSAYVVDYGVERPRAHTPRAYDSSRISDRRATDDRRRGADRRVRSRPVPFDRRSGDDRRSGTDRRTSAVI
jgi:hypothetical protein